MSTTFPKCLNFESCESVRISSNLMKHSLQVCNSHLLPFYFFQNHWGYKNHALEAISPCFRKMRNLIRRVRCSLSWDSSIKLLWHLILPSWFIRTQRILVSNHGLKIIFTLVKAKTWIYGFLRKSMDQVSLVSGLGGLGTHQYTLLGKCCWDNPGPESESDIHMWAGNHNWGNALWYQ